jgi:hypothetical protein
MRNEYKILIGKPEGKKPFGRPRRRWEVNIKMDQGKKRSEMSPLERSWRCGRTF